jgi:hypothetical protein
MTWFSRAPRPLLAAASIMLALACDSTYDDDGPTGNTGTIQVSASPATLSVPQGGTGTTTVTLTRGGGFTGVVTVSASGLPAGATATVDPAQLSGSNLTATVTMTIASTVPIGTYTVTVTAAGSGVQQATASYQLTVTAPPAFAMVVSPTTLTIPAGGTGSGNVQINRTNSSAAIALVLLTPPAGITATFDPTPAPANTSAMTVSVAANVAPGNYPITIQGTSAGISPRSALVTITVVPAPPSGNNVTYYFCHVDDVPAFFAYQDGAGAWQPVAGTGSGGTTTYSFNITQGRGGILSVYEYPLSNVARVAGRSRSTRLNRTLALTLSDQRGARPAQSRTQAAVGDAHETYVLYGTTSELNQDGLDSCGPPVEETKNVRGTFTGVAAGQYGIASLGPATVIFDGATATNPVTFNDVPAGLLDLVGSRIVTPGMAPDKLILMRNLNVPDGGSLPQAIDYNGPASLVPATATATISGAGAGDQLEVYVDLLTAHGSNRIWSDLAPSATSTRPWVGFPGASMVSGELHRLWTFASRSTPTTLDFRVVTKVVGPVANQALALGAELPVPTSSMVSGGAYPRFRFQGSIPADYNKGVSIDVLGEDEVNALYLLASGAYLAASGTPAAYNLTMPDVAGLPGFPVDARLTAGANAVTLALHGFTGPGFYEPRPSLGAESRGAYRGLTINVP